MNEGIEEEISVEEEHEGGKKKRELKRKRMREV